MAGQSRARKPQTGPRATRGTQAAAKAAEKKVDVEPGIVLDGVKYRFDDLNLGELSELEDFIGLPMDAISYGSAKTIAFVVYLVRRRKDPDYTIEKAQAISIREISDNNKVIAVVGGSDDPPL